MYLAYGWSPSGERLCEEIPFQRGKNFSVLGAFDLLGMVSTFQKEGSIKRLDLESFLEHDLLPRLEEGAVLVLDNARSHHGGRIAEIVEAAGCSLLYLPPYSPDFNPIELAWAWIKRLVRKIAPRDGERFTLFTFQKRTLKRDGKETAPEGVALRGQCDLSILFFVLPRRRVPACGQAPVVRRQAVSSA